MTASVHPLATEVTASRPVALVSPHEIAETVNTRLRANVIHVGDTPAVGSSAISSGFPALDEATGLAGFPRGRITELIGRPTSGRETVAAHTIASAPGYSAWVDVLGLVDIAYMAQCGVDLERLFVLQPRQTSDALAIVAHLVAAGHFSVVVLDALADLAPGGPTSQAVGQFIRMVTPVLGRTTTAVLILSAPENHYRPLAHAAALRISLVKIGILRRGGVFRGWRTQARILKSPGARGTEPGIEVWV